MKKQSDSKKVTSKVSKQELEKRKAAMADLLKDFKTVPHPGGVRVTIFPNPRRIAKEQPPLEMPPVEYEDECIELHDDFDQDDEDCAVAAEEDVEDRDFTDIISEDGEVVCSIFWDNGWMNSDTEAICKYKDQYWRVWSFGSEMPDGPFDTLDEAFGDEFLGIGGATKSIYCTELTTRELINRIFFTDCDPPIAIRINGTEYVKTPEGKLKLMKG